MKITHILRQPWIALYWSVLVLFAFFSYSLTDPNLVLINNEVYWQFQQWQWQTFYSNPQLQTSVFFLLFIGLFVSYLKTHQYAFNQLPLLKKNQVFLFILIFALPPFIAYNALSHDLFNYIFNAKMITVYQVDPHIHTALEFPNDEWTRFMHNTHTPAPYGYGWTLISLVPFIVGLGKFLLTWLSFKLWALGSYLLLIWLYVRQKNTNQYLWLVLLNPLLLIEVLSNGHNDLFMMIPALVILQLVLTKKQLSLRKMLLIVILFLFSVSIKFASLVMLPLLLLGTILNLRANILKPTLRNTLLKHLPLLTSIAFFLPLLTSRSQYFHPWYLIWALVWIPYIHIDKYPGIKLWIQFLLLLSFSSLLRYLPVIYFGDFAEQTIFWQRLLTWLIPTLGIIVLFFKSRKTLKTG